MVFLVGAIDIHDPDEYAKYRDGVYEALAPFNVEVLSVDGQPEVLEGRQPGGHQFIIKFESSEAVHSFYNSANYRKIIDHRHRASETRFLMVMKSVDQD